MHAAAKGGTKGRTADCENVTGTGSSGGQQDRAMQVWTIHMQQQQKGAQFQAQGKGDGAPADAVNNRAAQDHDSAKADAAPGAEPEPGDYPASAMPHGRGDNSPDAPTDASRDWDDVVQPEQRPAPARQASEDAEALRQRREQAGLQD